MAATEDRFVYAHERPSSVVVEEPLASGEEIFENTLVQLNPSGELESLTHAAGDDDSAVVPLVALSYQNEDEETAGGVHKFDRGGADVQGSGYENVLLELKDNDADLSNYTELQTTVYAVDNESVSATQADGSGGSRAPVGKVYRKKPSAGTVIVHVDGFAR
jgi:hypothetical protein